MLALNRSLNLSLRQNITAEYRLQGLRFATKKAGGSTKNGRDSPGQRLGLKKFGGEVVKPGNIIIRQRGHKYHHGENTKMGRDHTIYAVADGWVKFTFNKEKKREVVSVTMVNPNIPKTNFEKKELPAYFKKVLKREDTVNIFDNSYA